ncbi:pyridoxal-phosphate dependent enzyme, partial [Staphylococcus pseudintermedius]|uniref:pyridoxal-phosphate dependent enzyme n=1 Tax=Staphylococcus pseudintermedius TaxID=283734 RepID=UPI000E384B9E
TIGLEIVDQIWDIDTVVVPVVGGGLIAGLATALKSFNPSINIIGVQSENVHGMAESIKEGQITSQFTAHIIADVTEVTIPGIKTYAVVEKLFDECVLVY